MQIIQGIAIGDGVAVSDDFDVTSGFGACVFLRLPPFEDIPDRVDQYIDVQIRGSDGGYSTIARITHRSPVHVFSGVGTYRLCRDGFMQVSGADIYVASGVGSGGGGDASASNQLTQINRAEQANSYALDISNRVATADLQSVGNTALITIRDNASTIAGRIAPISATVARKVAITSTATVVALSPTARYIDFRAVGTDAYYVISTGTPTATTDSHYIGQDERIMRGVTANMSISVLSASGDTGMLYITER